MMRNISLLVNNYISCSIGAMRGSKKRLKGVSGLAIIIVLACGIMAFLFFQAWSIGMAIRTSAGAPDYSPLLYQGMMAGLVLVLFVSMQNITGGARARDADLLLSMPLTKTEIVAAKALSKYTIYFVMNFIASFTFTVFFFVYAGFTFSAFAASLVLLLLVPMFAVGLNYILDYLTIVVFGKSSFASVLRTIFSLGVLFAFIAAWWYLQLGLVPGEGREIILFPPITWMMDFVLRSNRLALLWLLLISTGSVALGIFLLATTLDKQNFATRRRRVNITRQRNRRPLTYVFLKELKVYSTLPLLMINTLFFLILMIALVAWVGVDGGASITNIIATIGLPRDAAVFGITVVLTFLATFVLVSCSSISLEGKNFWILKTMPIKPRDVFLGKAFFNIAIVAPVIVVSSIVLLIVMQLDALEFLLVLMLPLLANIFSSFGGVYINLLYPRFDWESEEAVIKRSMSVLITMLLGFAIGLVPVVMAVAMGFSNMMALWLVWAGVLCVMAVGSVVLTLTRGVVLYERL